MTHRLFTATFAQRSLAFGLALMITLSVLSGLGHTADQQFDQALLAQAQHTPTLQAEAQDRDRPACRTPA